MLALNTTIQSLSQPKSNHDPSRTTNKNLLVAPVVYIFISWHTVIVTPRLTMSTTEIKLEEQQQPVDSMAPSQKKQFLVSLLRWTLVATVIVWVLVLLHLSTLSLSRTAAAQTNIAGLQIRTALCEEFHHVTYSCENECYSEQVDRHCCYNTWKEEWC